jgi:hypothetical protein
MGGDFCQAKETRVLTNAATSRAIFEIQELVVRVGEARVLTNAATNRGLIEIEELVTV